MSKAVMVELKDWVRWAGHGVEGTFDNVRRPSERALGRSCSATSSKSVGGRLASKFPDPRPGAAAGRIDDERSVSKGDAGAAPGTMVNLGRRARRGVDRCAGASCA